MAAVPTLLTNGSDTDGGNVNTTASVSPTANNSLLIAVVAAVAGGGPTIDDGMAVSGLFTGTKIANITYGGRRRLWLFEVKDTGATPGSGTFTLTYTDGGSDTLVEAQWAVIEWAGTDLTTPFGTPATEAQAGGTEVSPTATGTVDTGDATFGVMGGEVNGTVTTEAGWTDLVNAITTGNIRRFVCSWDDAADLTPSWTWTGTNAAGGIAVLVKAAAGGENFSGTGTISATATLTASGTKSVAGTGTATEDFTITSGGSKQGFGTSSISDTATTSSTGSKQGFGTASISATATLTGSGTGSNDKSGTGTITGSATLTGSGTKWVSGNGFLDWSAELSGSGTGGAGGSGTVSGTATLTSSGTKGGQGTATLSDTAALASSAGTKTASGTGTITVTVTLTGVGAPARRILRGPVIEEQATRRNGSSLWWGLRQGISLLKIDGTYQEMRWPSDDEIASASVVYRGGYDHELTDAEFDDLVAAGYGAYITSEAPLP